MKRLLMMLIVMSLISAPVFAEELSEGMGDRAIRGFTNLTTGFIEFPVQIHKGFKNGCPAIKNETGSQIVGTVMGIFRGISHAAGRTAWGALELGGFWLASPIDNLDVGVPLDGEFSWDEGMKYSIFEPNLIEGIEPIFAKLGHGLANGVLGIAEMPGQIMKGAEEGTVFKGLVKGVWFTASREAYGITQIFTFLLPNPVDNRGYSFNEKWPWDALAEKSY